MKSQLTTLKPGYEAPAITSYDLVLEEGVCSASNEKLQIDKGWVWDEYMEEEGL